jgi:hypothetical protein
MLPRSFPNTAGRMSLALAARQETNPPGARGFASA